MKRKPSPAGVSRLFRPRHRHQKFRMLDEPGPDELLDDWMISGPATGTYFIRLDLFLGPFLRDLGPFLARFRKADRDRLLPAFNLLAGSSALERAGLALSSWLGRTFFAAPLEYFLFFVFFAIALNPRNFRSIQIGTQRSAKGSFSLMKMFHSIVGMATALLLREGSPKRGTLEEWPVQSSSSLLGRNQILNDVF